VRQIDRYEIVEELGQGSMGVVYKARDPQLDRVVAIKTLRDDLGLPRQAYAEFRDRFYQEASAAGRLNHPNIVAVYDVKEVDGTPYIVMEYVDGGRSLEAILRDEAPLPAATAVALVGQICGALGYAHAHGVVHRDIKPGNILVTRAGEVKVGDFGIARIAGRKLTQTGVKLGTPSYMSPEQARGRDVDSRSDLFSVGVILYEALTGADAFPGADTESVLYQIVHEPVRPLRERLGTVPAAMEAVVTRALAKDPQQRYQTAAELADAARRALTGPAGTGRAWVDGLAGLARRRAVLLGAGGLVVATAVAGVTYRYLSEPAAPRLAAATVGAASANRGREIAPKAPSGSGAAEQPGSPSTAAEPSTGAGGGLGASTETAAGSTPADTSGVIPWRDAPPPAAPPAPPRAPERRPEPRARLEPEASDPVEVRGRILAALAVENLRDVRVDVDRTLHVDLRGTVPDESSLDAAMRLTRGVRGVRSVASRLTVASLAPPSFPSRPVPSPPPPLVVASPADVQQAVLTALLANRLRDVKVAVDTQLNVHLTGTVFGERALQTALDVARRVRDVRSVTADIKVVKFDPGNFRDN
jgi:serine/threonine-protein kinase